MKFDMHFSSSAAEVPVKFQGDRKGFNPNLALSRLYKILRQNVYLLSELRPRYRFRLANYSSDNTSQSEDIPQISLTDYHIVIGSRVV